MSWQQESVTARQGSNISMMCIATDLDFLDVMRVELLASDGIMRTIADTATVKTPFSHIPRYVITFDYRDTIGNLTVTYQGMLKFYLLYLAYCKFSFCNHFLLHDAVVARHMLWPCPSICLSVHHITSRSSITMAKHNCHANNAAL